MASTDKFFKVLMDKLNRDPQGLMAISEIMESHMRYSIGPRLRSDPLTALAAVMREHDIKVEYYSVEGSACISISAGGNTIYSDSTEIRKKILFADIEPEPSND